MISKQADALQLHETAVAVKRCEHFLQHEERDLYMSAYVLVKANGDVYVYQKPLIWMQQRKLDKF